MIDYRLIQITNGNEPKHYEIRHFKNGNRTVAYNELEEDVLYLLNNEDKTKAKNILNEYYEGTF